MGKLSFYKEMLQEWFSNLCCCGYRHRHRARLPQSLEGKVIIVTGANSGIGLETSKVLVRLGATLIMACRNMQLAEAKRVEICNELARKEDQDKVILLHLDLGSFESIKQFAASVKQQFDTIDCLVANAGVFRLPNSSTVDGFEKHFGINHLGHFLLTQLLFDRLRAAKAARVVVVSSLVARLGKIHWDNIALTDNYGQNKAYSQSKLANVLFVRELAKRAANTSVTAYALHPGFVKSEGVERELGGVFRFVRCFAIDSWLGSQGTLMAALEEGLEPLSGSYFENGKKVDLSNVDDKQAADLWALSLKMCNLEQDLVSAA